MKAFRTAVADPGRGKALADVANRLREKGYELGGRHYKRFPRGLPEDGPAAEFLLHNALFVAHEDKAQAACAPGALTACMKHWRAILRSHRWLIDNVREAARA